MLLNNVLDTKGEGVGGGFGIWVLNPGLGEFFLAENV